MKNFISLNAPHLFKDEKKYIDECIKTNWVSSAGKFIDEFENKISSYTNSKYAIACSSGTAALHLSLKVSGVKKNDEVLVPSLTFVATINSILYVDAIPVFLDCDEFYNINTAKLIDFINNKTYFKNGYSYNKLSKRKISGILPVHVWGNAVDLKKITKLCEEKNIKIIEDASESLGTFYDNSLSNKHTGTIGEIGCISFNGNKIITTGGGGIILTNKKSLYKRCQYLSTQAKNDPIMFKHNEVGYNYRLNNMQAALGLGQLKNIDKILNNKLTIYNFYKEEFKKNKNFDISKRPPFSNNNNWMNVIKINSKKKINLKKIINEFYNRKIQIRPVWYPNHLQKIFKKFQSEDMKNTLKLVNCSICIPSSSNLKKDELKRISTELKNFFGN